MSLTIKQNGQKANMIEFELRLANLVMLFVISYAAIDGPKAAVS